MHNVHWIEELTGSTTLQETSFHHLSTELVEIFVSGRYQVGDKDERVRDYAEGLPEKFKSGGTPRDVRAPKRGQDTHVTDHGPCIRDVRVDFGR